MTVDQCINVLVVVTLVQLMVTIGLGVSMAELLGVIGNWRLLWRTAAANYVCVPAVTVALLWLFNPHPMVSAGFLILAVCPGAPFSPPLTSVAKGNVGCAVGMMILLAGSSAVLAPLLLQGLLGIASVESPVKVNASRIVTTLLATQLAPLCVGLAVRHFRPRIADRWQQPSNLLSKALNLMTIGAIIAVQFPLLIEIRPRGFAGMLLLLAASLLAGWLLAGRDAGVRVALSLTTALRNSSVGLAIAVGSFPGSPAVTAVAAYGLVSLLGAIVFAAVAGALRRKTGEGKPLNDEEPNDSSGFEHSGLKSP